MESHDEIREHIQDSWSAIDITLTQHLTEVVRDITLDFRKMLYATGEELEASHLYYMLDRLTTSIVRQCTQLTCLSVNIGGNRLKDQYYDDEDDDNHTTDEQWRVIGHIIKLVLKVVEETKELTALDLSFELYDISRWFPRIVPNYGQHSNTDLMIDPNMVDIVFIKETVDQNKKLLSVILSKVSIKSLSI